MWTKRYALLPMLLLCLCLAGWHAAAIRLAEEESRRLVDWARQSSDVELTIAVSEHYRIVPRKRAAPYCRFLAAYTCFAEGTELTGINLTVNFYDASGYFPRPGETWRVRARFHRTDYPHTASVSVYGKDACRLPDEHHVASIRLALGRFRQRLAEHLALGIDKLSALRIQTMTLGAYQKLPYREREYYAETGILHIFSISGLHVGILTGMLIGCIAVCGVSLRFRWLFLFPLLIGYLMMTGEPPSAARACFMAMIYCFAPCFMRKPDTCTTFFVILAVSLIVVPEWSQHIGALLSFSVMGGILLYFSPLCYFLNRLFHSHPQRTITGELPRDIAWHERFRRAVASILAVSLAAWIASLPLTLYFFARVPLGGLLLNLFVPTLTCIILWLGCLSALTAFICPWLAAGMNMVNATLLHWIYRAAEWMSLRTWCSLTLETPGGCFSVLLLGSFLLLVGVLLRMLEQQIRANDIRDPTTFRIFR